MIKNKKKKFLRAISTILATASIFTLASGIAAGCSNESEATEQPTKVEIFYKDRIEQDFDQLQDLVAHLIEYDDISQDEEFIILQESIDNFYNNIEKTEKRPNIITLGTKASGKEEMIKLDKIDETIDTLIEKYEDYDYCLKECKCSILNSKAIIYYNTLQQGYDKYLENNKYRKCFEYYASAPLGYLGQTEIKAQTIESVSQKGEQFSKTSQSVIYNENFNLLDSVSIQDCHGVSFYMAKESVDSSKNFPYFQNTTTYAATNYKLYETKTGSSWGNCIPEPQQRQIDQIGQHFFRATKQRPVEIFYSESKGFVAEVEGVMHGAGPSIFTFNIDDKGMLTDLDETTLTKNGDIWFRNYKVLSGITKKEYTKTSLEILNKYTELAEKINNKTDETQQ